MTGAQEYPPSPWAPSAFCIMEYDEEDLPSSYPNAWELAMESIRVWRGTSQRQGLGGTRQIPDESGKQDDTKTDYQRFYARAKKDPEWVAKRRAYYRARYAEGKKK